MVSKTTRPMRVSNKFKERTRRIQERIKEKYGIDLNDADITEFFAEPKIYMISSKSKKKKTFDDLNEVFPF